MDLKDYKVGVFFGSYYSERTLYCSCGHVTTLERNSAKVCGECGNAHVIDGGDYPTTRRIYDGIFECVAKDDKSFHLKKKEIVVHFKNDTKTCYFNPLHDWELKFNLRDKSAQLWKNGSEIACHQHNHKNINQFFKWGRSEKEIIPIFSTERSQFLYEFAWKRYGSQSFERVNMLGRALMRLLGKSAKLELFAFAGFGHNLDTIERTREWMDSPETKPHKIFGVPRYMLSILREIDRFDRYTVERFRKLDKACGGNNVKLIVQLFKEESSVAELRNTIDTFTELYENYGYRDVKRLSLYLAREVKLEQGITNPSNAAQILRDYVRMCKEMEIEPKEKYPKSLKKMHDIAQMNHRAKSDEIRNRQMKEVVEQEDYQSLTYKKKPYAIVTPRDASDLIKEGSSLSHCVASYVKDVIDKRCKILFLREADKPDESLVTIEVRDNNIRQVRGFGNRAATSMEMDFVREWSEKKGLNLATY